MPCTITKVHGKHKSLSWVGNNVHGKVFFKRITFGLFGMRKERKIHCRAL
jgi:hypothetical protein